MNNQCLFRRTPLVSSQSIREKMLGKTAVTFKRLEKHLTTYDKSSDWVMAGVILSKNIKTSQKVRTLSIASMIF